MNRILLLFCGFFFALYAFAQPQANFPKTSVNMGMLTWNYAGLATFDVVNTGTENLVIENVHPDCGCTIVAWTNAPIPPGESGTINVTYNAEMLGRFSKGMEVWTNALEQPVYLVVTGNVVKERKEYSGDFPYRIGDVYINTDEVEFDDVHRGSYPALALMIYNGGEEDYTPQLMHLPKYLTADYQPEVLRPGRMGKIILGLDSEKLSNDGLTQTYVYLSRFPGDKVKTENEIKISAMLLPEILLSKQEREVAPVLSIDTTIIDMRAVAGIKKKVKADIVLRNIGKSQLEISALQLYEPGVNVSLGKRKIEPGGSTRLKVTMGRDFSNAKGSVRILLITNDPNNSKVVVKLLVNKKAI